MVNRKIAKRTGKMSWKSVITAMLVFAILIIGGMGFGMFMTKRQGGRVDLAGLQGLLPQIVGFLIYIGWIGVVLGIIRPRIANWLGSRFSVRVEENTGTAGIEGGGGGWVVTSDLSLWKKAAFYLVEIIIFVVLLLAPLVIGIYMF